MIHAAIATVTKETVAVKWIALICSTKIDSSVFLAVYFHTIFKTRSADEVRIRMIHKSLTVINGLNVSFLT